MPELRNQRTFRYVPLNKNDESSTNFYENADEHDRIRRVEGGIRDCTNTILLTTENNDRKKPIDSNNLNPRKHDFRRESIIQTNSNSNNSQSNLHRSANDITNANRILKDKKKSINVDENCINDLCHSDSVNHATSILSSSLSSSLSSCSAATKALKPTTVRIGTTKTAIINPAKTNSFIVMANCLHCSNLMKIALISLGMILLYLTLSICLIFYQKSLVKVIKLPFAIVTYHLCVKLLMATIIRYLYNYYKLVKSKSRHNNHNNYSNNNNNIINNNHKLTNRIDWKTAVRKLAPTGIFSGIDIGFSNWALELVPISLYTMTKSSSIIFILLFAILLGLEKKSLSLVFIVSSIAMGLFMFTYKSTQFDMMGFLFILLASVCGGVRWTLAQLVMQKSKLGLHNPIDMIYYMQPWMIFSVLPFLIVFEGDQLSRILRTAIFNAAHMQKYYLFNIAKITFAAFLAFFMEVSEFLVLARTSSLTLSIACIFKDIFQLALAVKFDGDELSTINLLGLFVCLVGTCCHLIHKYISMRKLEEIKSFNDDDDDYGDNISTNESATIQISSLNAISNNILNKYNSNLCSTSLSVGKSIAATTTITSVLSNTRNNVLSNTRNNKTSLTIPLLKSTNNSDFDDDSSDEAANNHQRGLNSSDIVFDILKHRDITR